MGAPMEVQLILCDAAQAEPSGKVHMLGAGWSVTRSPTSHAVAVLVKVPWDRANESLPLRLALLTTDGQPVQMPTPEGTARIEQVGAIEVGRPAGVAAGSMLDAAFAMSVPPLPLPPGRYEWRLELAERVESSAFTVRD
jgi:hypothetical protein